MPDVPSTYFYGNRSVASLLMLTLPTLAGQEGQTGGAWRSSLCVGIFREQTNRDSQ